MANSVKTCNDCKFSSMSKSCDPPSVYEFWDCYRDLQHSVDPVTGKDKYFGTEYNCRIERQEKAGFIVRLYWKIVGHTPCGLDGRFFKEK